MTALGSDDQMEPKFFKEVGGKFKDLSSSQPHGGACTVQGDPIGDTQGITPT